MAHKGFQLGLEMPALLRGIATVNTEKMLGRIDTLEMPALLRGIATLKFFN